MSEFAVAVTTCASRDEARQLAEGLVEDRLAACVQIVPIASVYRWEGAVEHAAEHLLLCKIRSDDYAALQDAICARHSYATPEIIAMPIQAGLPSYLAWLLASTDRTRPLKRERADPER